MEAKTAAMTVLMTLILNGYKAFLAGGCVRDLMLGRVPKDYDVTTSARPDEVAALFGKTILVGVAFGVVVVVLDGVQIEVATFRTDGQYSDGRRPDVVFYSTSARADVVRRDFTMNGMLLNENGDTIDFVGGGKDIEAKVIRCIGDPVARFSDDSLRKMRAVRFVAQLGFEIEGNTFDAIVANPSLTGVSKERIAAELFKLVSAPFAAEGLVALAQTGLLQEVLPDVVLTHRHFYRFKQFQTTDPVMGMAMLLVDSGLAVTEKVCRDLKLSTEQRLAVLGAVQTMEFQQVSCPSVADVKLFARTPGVLPYGVDLLEQGVALGDDNGVEATMALIADFRALTQGDLYPTPLVTGGDLIALGLTPSPLFTRILGAVERAQLDGDVSTKEAALELAKGVAALGSKLTDIANPFPV